MKRRSIFGLFVFFLGDFQPGVASEIPPDDVLIVGAGLAGLSAAWYAREAGLSYRVLEATAHIGGRIRSVSYPEGVGAEAGLEEFWSDNPAVDLISALKLPVERGPSSFSSFMSNGRIHAMTGESNIDFVKSVLSPAEFKAYRVWDKRMAACHAKLSKRPLAKELVALQAVSFGEWMRRHSGLSPRALALVQAEIEPEFATSWDRISALEGIAEWHIFSGTGLGSVHVVGGNQRLVERLADALGRERVELNRSVTNLQVANDHVTVGAIGMGDYDFRQYRARHVVTTMPLYRLYEVQCEPRLPAAVTQAIDSQMWGSYFTAHVLFDSQAERFWQRDGASILPLLSGGPLGVIYEGHGASQSVRLLNLLVAGDHAEVFNARTGSVDHIKQQLHQAFERLWPGSARHIRRMTFVRYHPRALASWPVGRSRFDTGSQRIREPIHRRLHLAGDFTEGTHSDGAVRSARRAIAQVLADLKKAAPPSSPSPVGTNATLDAITSGFVAPDFREVTAETK